MHYRALLSRHRHALMGVAAVLIVFFHAEWKAAPGPLGLMAREGQLGVDMFAFLAGFGLAHSLVKRPSPVEYWSRRLRRLLPAYYVWLATMVLIALGLMAFAHRQGDFLHWLLLHLVPVGVWVNRRPQVWYVSAALGYYALAPVFFALMERARRPRIMAALLVAFAGVVLPSVWGMKDVEIALMRVPGLIAGLAVGRADAEGEPAGPSGPIALAALAGIGLCLGCGAKLPFPGDLKASSLHYLALDFMAPSLTVALAYLCEGLARARMDAINRAFGALGRVSLESYLAHVIVSGLVRDTLHLPGPAVLLILLATCYPLARAMAWAAGRLLGIWDRLAGKGGPAQG